MNAPPPTYDSSLMTTLTPYLTLPHLLSLTWLAYPILSLAFIAFRLTASLSSAQSSLSNAKSTLLASCKAAETAATSAASMPRFLAIKTNEQYVDAVNGSLEVARKALVLSLTIMEAVINFIVDIYRSTLLCFLELVVRGGLSILIGAVDEINKVVQDVATGLRSSIQNDIQSTNSVIQSAIDGINKVNPFGHITAPQITVPNLDALNNIQLPPTIQNALTSLNSSLPTIAELKNEVESIIDTPFELVKKDINDTFAQINLNPSGLPVPEQNLVSFCGDMDLSIVDELGKDLIKAAKISLIILFVIVLILIGLNCVLEWYRWRCQQRHMEYTRQAWATDPIILQQQPSTNNARTPTVTMTDHNLLILANTSSHPLITKLLNILSLKLHLSPSTHTTLTWFFSYIFHPPALACLLVGLLGLLSIQLQLLALRPLEAGFQQKGQQQITDFSNTIATSINATMYNQSASYASSLNSRLSTIQTTLDGGVLGWIANTTSHLNTTISNFYGDVQGGVEKVFGGTILESPVQEFVKCFLGSKVDAIEGALTFLNENVKVQMPKVNESVLVLQPDQVQEVSRPIALAAIGGNSDGSGGGGQGEGSLLEKIVREYVQSLEKERITFFVFLGCWFVVVLMGIIIILWNRRRARRMRMGITPAATAGGGNMRGGWFNSLRSLSRRNWSWRGQNGKADRSTTALSPFRMSVGEDGMLLPWTSPMGEKKGAHTHSPTNSYERSHSKTDSVVMMKNEGRNRQELPTFTPMPSPVPPPGLEKRTLAVSEDDRLEGNVKHNEAEGRVMRKTIGAGWAKGFADRFVSGAAKFATPSLFSVANGSSDSVSSSDSGIGIATSRGRDQKLKRNTLVKAQPFSQPREELLEDVPPMPTTPQVEEARKGLGFLGRKPSFFRPAPAKAIAPLVPGKVNPIAPLKPILPPTSAPVISNATMRTPPPPLRITVNPPSGDFSNTALSSGRPTIGLPMPMRPRIRNVSDSSTTSNNPFSPPPLSPPVPRKNSMPGVSPFSPVSPVFAPSPSPQNTIFAIPQQQQRQRFAPPIHHGFNDSRYPTLPGGKDSNGATTISSAVFRSGRDQQQRHVRRQSTLMVPTTPGGGLDHRRSFSVPVSAGPTPTTAGSTMTTSELQKSMLRGLSARPPSETLGKDARGVAGRPGLSLQNNVDVAVTPTKGKVNPFDDEHSVKIEKPAKTRKSVVPSRTSLKANPFEVTGLENW